MPTIFINHLVNLTGFPEAPNGSIKRTEPGGEGVPHFLEAPFLERIPFHLCVGLGMAMP